VNVSLLGRLFRRRASLHRLLDWEYGEQGDDRLRRLLEEGADPNLREGRILEAPLHVAVRRRRLSAARILLEHGADIDARTAAGQTAFAHAARRGFVEVADFLRERGADTELHPPDRLAIAVLNGRLDEARAVLHEHPGAARTGHPEADRALADAAGRPDAEAVAFLIAAGADLTATGLDSGTPLHQAAWFAQPANARLLIDAGAPLDVFDATHDSSPVGWAVHGSRYSGGADAHQDAYVELVRMLLDAGSSLRYPGKPRSAAYLRRLRRDATPRVLECLPCRLSAGE
jgi:ankyrin repeat protein